MSEVLIIKTLIHRTWYNKNTNKRSLKRPLTEINMSTQLLQTRSKSHKSADQTQVLVGQTPETQRVFTPKYTTESDDTYQSTSRNKPHHTKCFSTISGAPTIQSLLSAVDEIGTASWKSVVQLYLTSAAPMMSPESLIDQYCQNP
eukprot:1699_1